jgi:hypothetical protein
VNAAPGCGGALGGAWWILAVAGLLLLFAGLANVCFIGPLPGVPVRGGETR